MDREEESRTDNVKKKDLTIAILAGLVFTSRVRLLTYTWKDTIMDHIEVVALFGIAIVSLVHIHKWWWASHQENK